VKPHTLITRLGLGINLLNPDPATVEIEDIAHALGNEPRFGGHTRRFYSVAQHCIHVSSLVRPKIALEALMHDAHEAYLKDVPAPLLEAMDRLGDTGIDRMRDAVDNAVRRKFGLRALGGAERDELDDADMWARKIEIDLLMDPRADAGKWFPDGPPQPPAHGDARGVGGPDRPLAPLAAGRASPSEDGLR
jgi:hypothetical protein